MNHTNTTAILVAAASVAGRDHLRAGKNNQDAHALWRGGSHLCAVVADGCGSSPHSEVGAQLGARLLCNALANRLVQMADGSLEETIRMLADARADLLAQLRPVADALAGSSQPASLAAVVRDHLLFTLVGAIVGPAGVVLFAIGDGALALDGSQISLGPFPGNEPPYLGYALLPERAHGFSEPSLQFQIAATSQSWSSLAIGSDGALDLFAGAPPAVLTHDPRLFENPDALRRKLWLLAQGKRADEAPPLRDDTTLILLRNQAPAEA